MSAYEELKAWCEKHLEAEAYKAVPESEGYFPTFYFEPDIHIRIPCIVFNGDGSFQYTGTVTNEEMCEHIVDYERKNA